MPTRIQQHGSLPLSLHCSVHCRKEKPHPSLCTSRVPCYKGPVTVTQEQDSDTGGVEEAGQTAAAANLEAACSPGSLAGPQESEVP